MEFLAKHGPLRQLDHYGAKLNVLQFYCVDVVAFLAFVSVAILFFAFFAVRRVACAFVVVARKVKEE